MTHLPGTWGLSSLTADHRKDRHLDAVDQAGGHQRPVRRQAAVRAQRHLGFLHPNPTPAGDQYAVTRQTSWTEFSEQGAVAGPVEERLNVVGPVVSDGMMDYQGEQVQRQYEVSIFVRDDIAAVAVQQCVQRFVSIP